VNNIFKDGACSECPQGQPPNADYTVCGSGGDGDGDGDGGSSGSSRFTSPLSFLF